MELKRRKTDEGEAMEWTDYMSLTFTQRVRTTLVSISN
jgi:steroid 3-oxidase